ncbi:hypothetical protein GCM10011519_13850 [Marmoricola endophyticus]|uniref:Lipoprotein n=1 Tax=Marmoricola endophyticus TaxID=2040280 RepID=A0A917BFV0_9ACTN|nr:hypothetical protein [Marmoricola endophyticus]GGF41311.1 hypothetical protein GCM10011519_13850 [Marmoricola endophyticus]
MTRTRLLALPIAAVALSAGLTACGGGAELPSTKAGEGYDPATGPAISGTGYEMHAPKGWTDVTSSVKASQKQVDQAYASPQAVDNFKPNLNIIIGKDVGSGTPSDKDFDEGEEQLTSQLKKVGATNVKVQPRVALDGETAVHVTASASASGVEYVTDQYIAIHDGDAYTLTYSFPSSAQEKESQDVKGPSLASFEFTD